MARVVSRLGQGFALLCAVLSTVHCSTKACDANTTDFGDSGVAVRQSEIAGAGLGAFALGSFKQGSSVGRYHCTLHKSYTAATSDKPYSWSVNSTHGCDGEGVPRRNPMRYVNSIAGYDTCDRQNVKVHIAQHHIAGQSPISYVATRDITANEELLTDYGAVYFKGSYKRYTAGLRHECGLPALHLACSRGELETVRSLVQNETVSSWAGLTTDVAEVVNRPSPQLKWTPLMEAAAGGHTAVVEWLRTQGAEVNSVAGGIAQGITALSLASQNNHAEVVGDLIKGGAKVNALQRDGATALFVASRIGHAAVVQKLIEGGAAIDYAKGGATALFMASQMGHAEVVRALLKGGTAVNRKRTDGATALFIACHLGYTEVVRGLIAAGASTNDGRNDGATPLHVASQLGHVQVVEALVEAGTFVNPVMRDGTTPLFVACRMGHVKVVQMLIQGGAAIGKRKNNGATPLGIAKQMQHGEVVRLLLLAAKR